MRFSLQDKTLIFYVAGRISTPNTERSIISFLSDGCPLFLEVPSLCKATTLFMSVRMERCPSFVKCDLLQPFCKLEPRATVTKIKSQEKRQRLAGQSCFCTLVCEFGIGNHCGPRGEAASCVSYLGFIEIHLYLEKVPAHKSRCSEC